MRMLSKSQQFVESIRFEEDCELLTKAYYWYVEESSEQADEEDYDYTKCCNL